MIVKCERFKRLKSFLLLASFTFLVIAIIHNHGYALDFVLYGHNSVVWELSFDNDKLYSVGADGTLKVWNKELLPLQNITSHESWARCIDVSDKYVAVGGYKPDNTIKVYDKNTLKLIYTLKAHKGSVFTLLFYKAFLISAGSDNTIIVWKDFKPLKFLKIHDGWVRKLTIYNGYLVSGDENGRLSFSTLDDFKFERSFELKSQILSLHVFQNKLYVGSSDGSVYRFLLDKGQIKYEKVLSLKSAVQSITDDGKFLYLSVEGKVIVVNDETIGAKIVRNFDMSASEITSLQIIDKTIYVSNREGDIFKYSIDGRYLGKAPKHFLSSAKISANGNSLVIGREDGSIERYNVDNGLLIWSYKNDTSIRFVLTLDESVIAGDSSGKLLVLKDGKVQSVFYNEDAFLTCTLDNSKKNPIYLGSRGKVFSLEDIQGRWNLKTIAVISEEWICSIYNSEGILYVGTNLGNVYALDKMSYKPKLINSYPSPVVKISRLNSQIVVFHFNGTIAVFDGKVWKVQRSDVFPLYSGLVIESQIITGGSKLRIGNSSYEFEAFIVDLAEFRKTKNNIFASLSNGMVVQIEDGNVVRRFSSQISSISTIYADDLVICGHEDGKVSLWNYNKKQAKFELSMIFDDHTDAVKSITRYKKYIISASNDKTIKVWDSKTGKLLNILTGHTGYVWSIFVVGDILVSGGWDGKVILWNLKNFQKIKVYELPKLSITGIFAFSSDEIYLTTLEGFVVRINKDKVTKIKASEQTLWSIDSNYSDNSNPSQIKIYVAGWDGRVYVLDRELRNIGQFKGHNSTIFKIMFFDGKLFTAGTDNLIKVWRIVSDKPENIGSYSNFRQSILSVAISKTLGKVITTDGKGLISIDLEETYR
ncbi:hypothetical protein QO062_05180 [Fervidobacterium pennivorans subsp. carthaginiensis]|jgi:WD40 repeat protein|nr:hypothetical protein [Fervidobacterium pennivorans]QIV78471.1 hypothetical protein HER11_05655 [Fervidobacterium pennivorans subsp. keratinolyticus]